LGRDGLWATCPLLASSGYHAEFHEDLLSESYQSSSQRSIPTTVKSGSNTLQKGRFVKLLDQQFGYFRLQRGLSRRTWHCRSMVGKRHGMCELTHGMAGEQHAMCESALVGQGLLIMEASLSHSDTPHSVGLLWTRDQP